MSRIANIQFISVNFNNAAYSKQLLASVERQRGRDNTFTVKCVIVDNSTNDADAEECEAVTRPYPWVEYVHSTSNLGYFGGLNAGLGISQANTTSYVVVCNNDVAFSEDFCDTLSKRQYSNNVLAVCPDVITRDGLHQNPHIYRRISWLRRFQFDVYYSHYYMSRLLAGVLRVIRPVKSSRWQPEQACETHMGVGACYVLTAGFMKRFDHLSYPHFLYGEEAYISDQIHAAGGILWYDPDLRVDHAESAALSKVPKRTTYEYERSGYPDFRKML